jgi:hemoglobin
MTSTTRSTIYDEVGGAPAVAAVTHELYRRMLADPLLARHFAGVDLSALNKHVRMFLAAALGGPELYQGPDMRSAHAHVQITSADWDAAVGHLVATLQSLGVSDELIRAIAVRVLPLREQIVSA